MVPKTEAVLIIGDSNIRHLERDIMKDKLLSQKPLTVDGVSGRRAMDLTATDVDRAAKYRFVVVMLGKNDLEKFRNRNTELPINVACKLIAFCQVLSQKGKRVRVVKLLPRLDVAMPLIIQTNEILQRHLGRNLFKQVCMFKKQFDNKGGYHPVPRGKLDILRLLLKACETFGYTMKKWFP